ncbi:MAG TPA: hypothetical protein VGK67_15715 [Myxococcales bacterium]|jgi:hypothetical protein
MLSRLVVVAASMLACSLAQAQPVVRVMILKGSPKAVSKAQKTALRVDQELSRDDRIEVPSSSWVVLQILKNDFVVKIDEDLEMPVGDIALLDASPKGASITDQLEAMVRAREIDTDRVTGYQNRRVAGEGSASGLRAPSRALSKDSAKKSAERKEAPAAADEKSDRAESEAAAPAPPPPPAKPAPVPSSPAPAQSAAELPGGGAGAHGKSLGAASNRAGAPPARKAAAQPVFAWATVIGGRVEQQRDPLDPELAGALRQADLAPCIEAAWKAAGLPAPKADSLLLRRVDGKVQAKLGSRLALDPACARPLDAFARKLPDRGWIRVEIRLAGQ